MGLDAYKQKRTFSKTPEPTGGRSSGKALAFVIQKHQASHLHYDFRLELKGVLKSWAVPKGPSMDPEVRRLAQLVEDHPFDYKDFEGIIPPGNYGAGTVIIWDQGTYQPAKSSGDKKEDEKILIRQFHSGKISIVMKGKKLKGGFTLVKTPARGDNAWLLFKTKDKHVSGSEVTRKDKSVVSGLTIEDMSANENAAHWKSNRTSNGSLKIIAEPKGRKSKFDQVETWKRLHDKEVEQVETLKVEGREIHLVNYEQDYWSNIRKLDVIIYYRSIAEYLLPFLYNRPMGLRLVSEWAGENKEHNFFRNMKGNYPSWIKTFTTGRRVKQKDKSERIDWVLCNDLATLIYLLNLGAIDFHPWAARTSSPNEPDYLVIDLDPDKTGEDDRQANTKHFRNVVKIAQAARQFFDEYDLTSYVKTSGKTGLHILIPCSGISYDHTRAIAEKIANHIHQMLPKISTVSQSKHGRNGKVYIDPSQNDYSDRLVAPYCIRAYKQPFVSCPLEWDEVNSKLERNDFTIHTMAERLKRKGDLFKDVLNSKIAKQNSRALLKFISDLEN